MPRHPDCRQHQPDDTGYCGSCDLAASDESLCHYGHTFAYEGPDHFTEDNLEVSAYQCVDCGLTATGKPRKDG